MDPYDDGDGAAVSEQPTAGEPAPPQPVLREPAPMQPTPFPAAPVPMPPAPHPPMPPEPVPHPTLPVQPSPRQAGPAPMRIDDAHAVAVSKATAAAVGHAKQFVSRNNVLAVPALLLACLGVVTYVCAPVGAILGHVARRQIRERGQTGNGFALAAVIIGWSVTGLYTCGLVLPLAIIIIKAGALAAAFS
ncbi:DUF4190 domain-containing protein [Catellatospora sichuanensis]|uniref:DUF4190 domain-containing protein n=1 Tax=Catellatospora sichuanensis TaxID=1969805 RepID=UPI001FE62751|nr:DUF4190 domain-containing protein [Catellatospora sichuanensis]